MKVEIIILDLLGHSLNHATSSGASKKKYDKKDFYTSALSYIEQHMTKNGMELVNVHGSGQVYAYHLIKR
ncbi:MAG: hypothetical protein KGD73_02650 [Candidatus Lokiarchaeota archaeon]|nr:hypothetical protein [Candidatus Lokiarchaeota archaeon]